MSEREHVVIYVRGSCLGDPGPGGYGAVLLRDEKRREISAGCGRTTYRRMEIMALIAAFQALRYPCAVTICTDSTALVRGITNGWAERWRAGVWGRRRNENLPDADLWQRLIDLCLPHHIRFERVVGPGSKNENQCCQRLAAAAARRPNLPADEGYRPQQRPTETGVLSLDWE
jgi:ribonuclease HI